MPLTKLHFILLGIVFLLLPQLSHSQKQSSIRLHFYPYMQEIGDLNKRYTSSELENFHSFYEETPHFELGASFYRQKSKRFGWDAGLSYRESETKIEFRLNPFDDPRPLFHYSNETFTRFLRLNLGANYCLNEAISLRLGISVEGTNYIERNGSYWMSASYGSNVFGIEDGEWTIQSSQLYKFDVRTYNNAAKIVPEISMSLPLLDRLSLNVGFRCKFWKSTYGNHIATVERKSSDKDTSDFYVSKHDKREFSVFTGLTYSFRLPPFRKKIK